MAASTVDFDSAALAAIRAFLGWHLAPVRTETVVLSVLHASHDLPLPTGHVTSIEKVEVRSRIGVWLELPAESFEWDADGLLRSRVPFRRGLSNVRVTMTHGYSWEDVPDVAALAATISRRARMNPAGLASQSVNGAAVSYQTAGGAPLSVGLLSIERQALESYRANAGWIAG